MVSRTMLPLFFVLILSQSLAPGKSYPWSYLPGELGRWIWIGFSILCFFYLVFQVVPARLKSLVPLLQSRGALIALLLFNLGYSLFSFFKFKAVGYSFPWIHLILCVFFIFTARRDQTGKLMLFNGLMLFASIIHFPLTGFRSDMLLVNQQALQLWWNHQDPYQPMQLAWGLTGMPYFPGILFSHFPAWFLGLDLRWGQLAYRVLWMGLLWRTARKLPQESLVRDGIHYYLLNPYLNFRHDLYFEIFFVWLAFYFTAPRLRHLWIALLAVTTQWAVILCPFLMNREVFEGSTRNRMIQAGRILLALVFVVGGVHLLLWSTTSWESFKTMAFGFQSRALQGAYHEDFGISFAPIAYWLKSQSLFLLLQVLICLGMWWKDVVETARGVPFSGKNAAMTWVLFTLFATHFWNYFWLFSVSWILFSRVFKDQMNTA